MRYRPSMSSVSFFVYFLVLLGWEGPLSIYFGIVKGSMSDVCIGIIVTLFFWGLFGWWAFVDTIKLVVKKLRE